MRASSLPSRRGKKSSKLLEKDWELHVARQIAGLQAFLEEEPKARPWPGFREGWFDNMVLLKLGMQDLFGISRYMYIKLSYREYIHRAHTVLIRCTGLRKNYTVRRLRHLGGEKGAWATTCAGGLGV